MLFNSLKFLAFFPAVTLLYFVLPKRLRWGWLLVASYVFYMGWNPAYALLLAFSTLATYLCGLVMGSAEDGRPPKTRKLAILLCVLVNLGILFFFKYYGFFTENVVALGHLLGVTVRVPTFDVLLPVGISFYTFQAIGYTVDVYRGEIKPERNLLRYALFVSFFPQLVAGPIERSSNILPQLYVPHRFAYERVRDGLAMMLWGFFQKMVVADRVAVLVSGAWASYQTQGGGVLITAAVFFAMQVYCDFAGYSNIALGAAQVLGIRLMDNFRQPYLATSLQDFWRRWHISLSTWLGDYVFTPLVWSRWTQKLPLVGKHIKNPPKYSSLMATFLISGLWHGASWTYVVWGGLHGAYQVVGGLLAKPRSRLYGRLHINKKAGWFRLGQTASTFALVCASYIFFAAGSLGEAFGYLGRMFSAPFLAGDVLGLGMNAANLVVSLLCIALCFVVDLLGYKTPVRARVARLPALGRGVLYMAGLVAIIIFGMYGEGNVEKPFLYFQF